MFPAPHRARASSRVTSTATVLTIPSATARTAPTPLPLPRARVDLGSFETWGSEFCSSTGPQFGLADFNGDGLQDLWCHYSNSGLPYSGMVCNVPLSRRDRAHPVFKASTTPPPRTMLGSTIGARAPARSTLVRPTSMEMASPTSIVTLPAATSRSSSGSDSTFLTQTIGSLWRLTDPVSVLGTFMIRPNRILRGARCSTPGIVRQVHLVLAISPVRMPMSTATMAKFRMADRISATRARRRR